MSEKIVNINIAELLVTRDPVVICTVLGSCVSVCLFTEDMSAGGMIHYALPNLPTNCTDNPLRYGDFAIESLVGDMVKLTGKPASSLLAKVIGGANNIATPNEIQKVGSANIEIAKHLLAKFKIRIMSEELGGSLGRKVLFHAKTGRLQSAYIGPGFSRPSAEKAITMREEISSTKLKKKKVLIVDDSKTIRDLLIRIISKDPELEVIGQAEDPIQAQELLRKIKPDVITLDIHMPNMTGVQWLKTLIPKNPIPVVMITSLELKEGNEVFQALEYGAIDYIQKPTLHEIHEFGPAIIEKIKNAAGAKVRISRLTRLRADHSNSSFDKNLVLALGASTGGTEALKDVLIRLPKEIPPTVIVQHIPPIFSRAFSDRLNQLCPFEVKEAEDGDALHENRVLVAPGGTQMKVVRKSSGLFVEVNDAPPMNRHKPSVDYLFNSVAELCGKNAMGVILTGMGADGAKGLLHMKNCGALTFSQDEASCVVYGMPKAAWELGGSLFQVSLEDVAAKIVELGKLKRSA
jgi:two-component system chemotaxis response regulator CheB